MFDPTSRYAKVPEATLIAPDGRMIPYKLRRLLPPGPFSTWVELTVTEGDRLDLITARTLGDPEQFWRVADANFVLRPAELTEVVGRVVHVPIPEV